MGKFFKFVFGSFIGGLIGSVVGVFLFFVMIAASVQLAVMKGDASSARDPKGLLPNSVLVLDLETPISEISEASLVSPDGRSNIHDIRETLSDAARDTKIKALLIKGTSGLRIGWSTSKELRKAIKEFSDSGKSVVAFSEVADEKALYIMTAANKVYMHPTGGVSWDGFASTPTFYKGFFDKVLLRPIIFRAGKFKSAIERFINKKMSPESKQQTAELIEDLWEEALEEVSVSRGVSAEELREFAENVSIQTSAQAKKVNLIDGLVRYSDLLEKLIKNDDKKPVTEKQMKRFVSVSSYKGAKAQNFLSSINSSSVYSKKSEHKNKIAVLVLEGSIMSGRTEEGVIGSDSVVSELQKLRMNKDVRGVIIRVNSPGGSALASDVIWYEIEKLKKIKKVYVSMGDVAASGGYYISAGAHKIFAEENTITGSIGVFTVLFNSQQTMEEKVGLSFDRVVTSQYADIGSGVRDMEEGEKEIFQTSVDRVYKTFLNVVEKGRKFTNTADVEMIAQGRVWSGNQAKEIGLVDELGDLEGAALALAEELELSEYELDYYPKQKAFGALFTKLSKFGVSLEAVSQFTSNPTEFLKQEVKQVFGKQGEVLMLSPYLFDVN